MKIGILTFHRAINYGAVLQCTALYMVLKNMGHDVEVIDYRPDSIEHDRKYFSLRDLKNKNLKSKFLYIMSCLLQFFSKRRMKRTLDDYLHKSLKLSGTSYTVNDISKDYDAIFFGSDQIWNPKICYGLDKGYFGNFDAGKARKISYAASLGRPELITDELSATFQNYVKGYDILSVRERALKDLLLERYSIDSTIVCDPSLLPDKEVYYELTHPVRDENYIVLFILERNSHTDTIAKTISQQTGAKVLKLFAQKNPLIRTPFEVRKELSPSDFLSYIRYAKCVITDSFHTTSFSLIMQTNFYTIRRRTNNDRSETILNITGLLDRMIEADADITYSDTDFSGVEIKLKEYKNHSLDFIKESLK